jgi:hypothetical protein
MDARVEPHLAAWWADAHLQPARAEPAGDVGGELGIAAGRVVNDDAGVDSSRLPVGDTLRMSMTTIDLQRRTPGERADELLDGLQAALAEDKRVRWNESGHARIDLGREREDAREHVAARLDALGEDWPEHIAIL